jgi:phospholipid/cholesterol/gamma-HCH transport system substrate-binding protein
MRGLSGVIVKSLLFVAVTVLATGTLALTIHNTGGGTSGQQLSAVFSDASSLNVGDDVRMAGVRVGEVSSIRIVNRRQAQIGMSLESSVPLARTLTATIRFRNLIGQRYVELDEGGGSVNDPLPDGSVIPISRTHPALDLTVLFNGFQPLFQALDPKQVNQLSTEIVQVFQGEGPNIDDLLARTATLTSTLAGKDKLIGEVVDNLNAVLGTVNAHGSQLRTLVTTMSSLVSGLSADRFALGHAVSGLAGLSRQVTGLLRHGRAPLHADVDKLGTLSQQLASSSGALDSFLRTAPDSLNRLGRVASYGSWLNVYECSITGRIPVPSQYFGGVGAQPAEARCGS